MIAEQYQGKMHKKTLKTGEVVIVSPEVTIQSVYLWFYAAINFGSTGAISASFLARDHGYWVAYLVPTGIFCLVPLVLMAGRKYYVVTPPRGSILLETFRVIGMALAPAWSFNPLTTFRNIRKPDFWDPAKPSVYQADRVPSRITWDDEFVGEVARTVNACGVFLFFPFYWLCYSQIDGNLGTTAAAMTLNGTPNDLIQNLNPISIIILIPIFDRVIYPFLRKRGINFSPIKRIYAGFLVAGTAMIYASVLQSYIGKMSPCGPSDPALCEHPEDGSELAGTPWPANINVWVVSGPYILVGHQSASHSLPTAPAVADKNADHPVHLFPPAPFPSSSLTATHHSDPHKPNQVPIAASSDSQDPSYSGPSPLESGAQSSSSSTFQTRTAAPCFQDAVSATPTYNAQTFFPPQTASLTSQASNLNTCYPCQPSEVYNQPLPPSTSTSVPAMYGPYSVSQDVYSSSGLYHDSSMEQDLTQTFEHWDAPGKTWEEILLEVVNRIRCWLTPTVYELTPLLVLGSNRPTSANGIIAQLVERYPRVLVTQILEENSLDEVNLSPLTSLGGGDWCDIGAFNSIAKQNQPQLFLSAPNFGSAPKFTDSNGLGSGFPSLPSSDLVSPRSPARFSPTGSTQAPSATFQTSAPSAHQPVVVLSTDQPATDTTTSQPALVLHSSSTLGPNLVQPTPHEEHVDTKKAPTPFMVSMNSGLGNSLFGQSPSVPTAGITDPFTKPKRKKPTGISQQQALSSANKENIPPVNAVAPSATGPQLTPPSATPYPSASSIPALTPPTHLPTPSPPEGDRNQVSLVHDQEVTRRSARGPVKNTWFEKQNLIGTNTPLTSASVGEGASSQENTSPLPWFENAIHYFQMEDLGDLWKDVVEKWAALE
ncbi:hypothetical protein NMY22_g19990 [Coprinellus aureogranulatus]|nr:hypothetical protein NMY22_g19990 [Coprinellus aureogranulatus]